MAGDPILIWGAGAIGGTVGAYLIRAGVPVLFVDRSAKHTAAINAEGLLISGPIEEFRVAATAVTPDGVSGKFRLCFLCVKSQDTVTATDELAPFLAEDGCVVSLQNGLNELAIAERVGEQRTVAAFVNFGADYCSPGVIQYGGRGAVVVGEMDGSATPRIEEIHRFLKIFDERALLSSNVWGYLWSKLAYAALMFPIALTNDSIADGLASPKYRRTLIACAREVVSVALAKGVKLEPFDGFDPLAFMPDTDAAAQASMDAMIVQGRKSAKTHTGIWRDLAIRKRKTEAQALLHPVLATARSLSISAPLTQYTLNLIGDIEGGRRALGHENLDELTRVLAT